MACRAAVSIALIAGLAVRAPTDLVERETLAELARVAGRYEDDARRFTCTETVRWAGYRGYDRPFRETLKTYDYLLIRAGDGRGLREHRGTGRPKSSRKLPPVYAWTLLFSDFHQPYFSYRDRGEEAYGFERVQRIGFRGSIPFSDGVDIRQWEGFALVDVRTRMPVEVVAEPLNQPDRLVRQYLDYKRSFRVTLAFYGFRLASLRLGKRPFGRRVRVRFRLQRNGLRMPWLMELEKYRMVGRAKSVPWAGSWREYADYRFFETEAYEATRKD
jgi:hypothetical protein